MAGKGGKRPGAGRKPGSKLKRTQEIANRVMAEGMTPLEFMLEIMRDDQQLQAVRLDAAKSAAPYIHPRLANITANANVRMGISLVDEFPG